MKQKFHLIFFLSLLLGSTLILNAEDNLISAFTKDTKKERGYIPMKKEVVEMMQRANQYWQRQNPRHSNSFWNRAVYHTGNIAAYEVTKDVGFLDFSIASSI